MIFGKILSKKVVFLTIQKADLCLLPNYHKKPQNTYSEVFLMSLHFIELSKQIYYITYTPPG